MWSGGEVVTNAGEVVVRPSSPGEPENAAEGAARPFILPVNNFYFNLGIGFGL